MAFTDKNQFGTGDPEDGFQARSFSPESDMESPDEESPDDDEFAELSEEEMRPFTLAEWQQSMPDYTAEELEEKLPKPTRESWMAPVMSCLWGTLLGAVVAGGLVNDQPKLQQAHAFFIFFFVLALLFSCIWHWLFYLRPKQLTARMREQEADPVESELILPNKQLQEPNTAGSEPIHPK
jgi:hypothetical protein